MKFLTLSIIFTSLIATCLFSITINVPTDQPTIQEGIDVAVDADTVLVQPGTYFENINYNGKNITVASLFLTTADTTYISQTFINNNENGSVVVFSNGEDSTAVLTGFTLTNGTGTYHYYSSEYRGGGIYCENSNPEINYNKIVENDATNGGGIFCVNSSPLINNNIISDNTGIYGGGISCKDDSNPIISNSVIKNNVLTYEWQMASQGGGICCWDSSPRLYNVIISENFAPYNGGGISCRNSSPILNNVTISGNTVGYGKGGGIYCFGENSNPILQSVTITDNFAYYGGGITCSQNSSVNFDPLNRCNIFLNYAGISGSDLHAYECPTIDVIVDTFTVLQPDDYFVSPMESFTFDILNPKVELVEQDLYVSPEGSNENSGLTAHDPLQTISHALLTIASDSLENHAIHLAEGVYSFSITGEQFPLHCKSFVPLYGASEESTILDGEESRRILHCDNVTFSAIENMTIQNGNAYSAGGVECNSSSINLTNVTISDCIAAGDQGGYTGGSGGGICCSGFSDVNLRNVSIEDCAAYGRGNRGGGICCSESSMYITNSIISDNYSTVGAGIFCSGSSLSITNSNITSNTGYWGSGIFCQNSDPDLINLSITGNSGYHGGGCFFENSNPILEDVSISNNTAEYGGGIYCKSSTLNFSSDNRCNIYLNDLSNCHVYGAEIYAENCDVINVIVDTFTVMVPTDYFAYPIDNFTFDIQHCYYELIDADLYVSPDGDNSNSGTSPDEPLQTIDYALTIIYPDSVNINTIHLAPGVYSNSTNEEIFPIIFWRNYVNLNGNSEDDTILDAESTSRVMVFIDITDAVISNITVTNGYTEGGGGGVVCDESTPSFMNIKITGNSADHDGGGIYCWNSNPTLTNLTISDNFVNDDGGGMYCNCSNPCLMNVTISDNYAGGGGGISCDDSSPILINVTISDNYAGGSGGIQCSSSCPILNNVTISDNFAEYGSGGISFGNSSPILNNVTISGNTVLSDDGCGGGVGLYSDFNPIMEKVIITDNFACYGGGGIYCAEYSNPIIENVIISGNSAENGGGVYCGIGSDPNLVNVTISDNSAYENGGGIYCGTGADPSLLNVTISGNSANDNGGGIYWYSSFNLSLINSILWNDLPQEIYVLWSGSVTASYSDIQGGWEGIGNIDEDPLFVGTGEDPYSLLEGSPCIDTGDPDALGLNLPPWDIIGNERIWDGDGDGTAIIDMGAYEYGAPPYVEIDDDIIVQTPGVHLYQNYPNPFNPAAAGAGRSPATTIRYQLAEVSKVSLKVYNIRGQLVRTLLNEIKPAGEHSIIWDGMDKSNHSVPSGVYLYRLKTEDDSKIRKMILLR